MAAKQSSISSIKTCIGAIALGIVVGVSTPLFAQDENQSSRRETETIKMVEEAGGRVYKISAAGNSRELSFYLSNKPIGDQQLKGINAIGEVIWVNLAGTEITNDGLQHLAGMPIQKLHLERTKIGDDGLKHVTGMKELVYLNIYDTKVSDAGLEHLKELKNLKKLFVWKSAVTEAGIKKLNESLPDLKIVGELKLEPVVVEEPKEEAKPAAEKKDEANKEDGKPAVEKKDSDKKAEPDVKKEKPAEQADDKKADNKKTDDKKK